MYERYLSNIYLVTIKYMRPLEIRMGSVLVLVLPISILKMVQRHVMSVIQQHNGYGLRVVN